jgi:hypothetical protein
MFYKFQLSKAVSILCCQNFPHEKPSAALQTCGERAKGATNAHLATRAQALAQVLVPVGADGPYLCFKYFYDIRLHHRVFSFNNAGSGLSKRAAIQATIVNVLLALLRPLLAAVSCGKWTSRLLSGNGAA